MTLARLNGYERHIALCVPILAVLFTMLSSATLLAAQNPEYDFYPELRNSFTPKSTRQNSSPPMTQELCKRR